MTWLMLLAVCVTPALVFGICVSLFPTTDETPRWRMRLARRLDRFAARLRHEHQPTTDPFATLRVQERLGAVAHHVLQLEEDTRGFARAERIIASQLAYDQLLAEACQLAGVEVEQHAKGDPAERFREEVELASRGWTW